MGSMVAGKYKPLKVTGYSCRPTDACDVCCTFKTSPGAQAFKLSFCMALCQIACFACTITFEGEDATTPEGPVLADDRDYPTTTVTDDGLSFTTSQYGLFIPIVFGSDKLNGNVFWASPIQHVIKDTTLPDGTPEQIYYRSLNFAFGICEGEINGLLRMWLGEQMILDLTANTDENGVMQPNADGFIYGTTVDLTDPESPLVNLSAAERQTKITVFTGAETQLPEGAIVAAEGYENTPAYRGLAYILFENFVIGRGSSVPNIFAEITSNTENSLPRLVGQLAVPEENFNLFRGDSILYDLSYDRIFAWAEDTGTPSPLVPGGRGLAIFDGNTLEAVEQQEIEETLEIGPDRRGIQLCARSPCILMTEQSGNQGIVYTYNPYSRSIVSTLGPGGSIAGHSMSTGFGAILRGGCMLWAPGRGGIPTDIYGAAGFVNESVGFAEIDETGDIRMTSVFNGVISGGSAGTRCAAAQIPADFSQAAFVDGSPAAGTHMYAVTMFTEITVQRFTIDGMDATVYAPTHSTLGTIPLSEFAGAGFDHQLIKVMVDPVDQCLILFVHIVSNDRSGRIAKWNPFTGVMVWSTAVGALPDISLDTGGESAYLITQQYAWIMENGSIQQISLATGELSPATTLAEEGAPSKLISAAQFYNGYEESITYISTTNRLVKIFLNRRQRQTVDLGDIVSNLCQRVGLLSTDIDRQDLDVLSLHGYTIKNQKSLRECFSELGQAFKYDVIESNGRILYKTRGDAAVETISHVHLADTEDEGWLNIRKENDISRIRKINLTYRDIDRDYDTNVQSIILPRSSHAQNWDNDAAIDVTVPIVLDADTAKSLAEILLYSKLVYDTQYEGLLAGRYLNLDPSDVVDIQMDDEGDEVIRMRLRTLETGADRKVKFEASQEDPDIYTDQVNLFGSVGRYEKSQFNGFNPRVDAMVLPIPYKEEAEVSVLPTVHHLYIALINTKGTSHIPESITLYIDATERVILPPPDHFPTWGHVLEPPVFRTAKFSTDRISRLRVRIVSEDGATIASVTKAELLEDDRVNLCYVAGELMQYEEAEEVEDGVWEFRNLHRGKYGTETAVGNARAGNRFVLIGDHEGVLDDAVQRVEVPFGTSPRKGVQIFVSSNNPFQPAPVTFASAANYRQLAPAHVKRAYVGEDVVISWQRRTRFGDNEMQDGTDAVALNEASESYDLYLHSDLENFNPRDLTTYFRKVTVTAPNYTYLEADQIADGFVNNVDTLYIVVYQTGAANGVDTGSAKQVYLEPKV